MRSLVTVALRQAASCYQRRPLLGSGRSRDLFLQVLEQVRRSYRFVVVGSVVMPEHIHLLLSEPERGDPSIVMQVIKQSFARKLLRESPPFENRERWDSRSRADCLTSLTVEKSQFHQPQIAVRKIGLSWLSPSPRTRWG